MRQYRLLFFLLSLAICAIPSQVQSYQPQQVYACASAFVEGQAMYVAGGRYPSGGDYVGQMFWIDLSTPWSTSSPAYNRLLDGMVSARVPSALVDNNNWFFLVNQTTFIYNINNSTWTNITTDPTITPALGLAAALDPDTNNVYVPNVRSASATTGDISLFIYSFSERTFRHDSTQETLKNLINYNAVWAPTLNSMLVFGGNIDGEWNNQNSLYAYSTASGWSTPPVSGDIPPPRTLACLVPAYSGTKMILYGGFASSTTNTSGPAFNDIYVLDVATYTWTKGSSSSAGRGGQACAVSGDYFIVWGGYSVLASTSLTMVYDIKADSWITNYAPPPFRPSPTPSPRSPSTSNVPLIAGCASGAVVIILLVVGFIWYRKRSNMAHSEAGLGSEEPKQYPQQKQSHDYQVPSGQQPQHIYQPPVIAADPAAGYYQQIMMSPDQATGYCQPMKETHHVFQPQIYQPSPALSDQSTAYSHDITSPRASIVTAATASPQTNIRNPQDIL